MGTFGGHYSEALGGKVLCAFEILSKGLKLGEWKGPGKWSEASLSGTLPWKALGSFYTEMTFNGLEAWHAAVHGVAEIRT